MRAIFLDRDGVINKYPGDGKYVTSWKEFHFLLRARPAVAKLNKNNFRLFIISNQAGVGKGIYLKKDLDLITKNMLKDIVSSGGKIDAVYYGTHRKEEHCPCRKPKAGLIKLALKKHRLDIKNSFFIGDTIRDVITAKAAGCKSILIFSGKEKPYNRKNWKYKPDFVFKDLWDAAKFITGNK